MDRVASVRVDIPGTTESTVRSSGHRLAAALLAGSPRVALAGPGLCRVDPRGWGRRGGEIALARTLLASAAAAGFRNARVGIADVAIAADAASWLAAGPCVDHPGVLLREEGTVVVGGGAAREFLAPLPLAVLLLPDELGETLRALGLRRVGDLAGRERSELEARFGAAGFRAHRLACGEDDRTFRPIRQAVHPEASLELEGAAETLEPLLFVLRHLLDRVCADLSCSARCAAGLSLELLLADGTRRRASVVPARPTRQERLLYDLCRAALERAAGERGRLAEPVLGLALRVENAAPPGVRQGDLFAGDWRDPMAAAAALSRLQARMGENAVVWPCLRPDNRPETRNAWRPVEMAPPAVRERPYRARRQEPRPDGEAFPCVLRLLPDPVMVRVRTEDGCPVELLGVGGRLRVVAAEGPERLSGDWWKDSYHREYFRVCTADGELLWVFREYRHGGGGAGEGEWWLHGWWD